jgi:hypothetical protein
MLKFTFFLNKHTFTHTHFPSNVAMLHFHIHTLFHSYTEKIHKHITACHTLPSFHTYTFSWTYFLLIHTHTHTHTLRHSLPFCKTTAILNTLIQLLKHTLTNSFFISYTQFFICLLLSHTHFCVKLPPFTLAPTQTQKNMQTHKNAHTLFPLFLFSLNI